MRTRALRSLQCRCRRVWRRRWRLQRGTRACAGAPRHLGCCCCLPCLPSCLSILPMVLVSVCRQPSSAAPNSLAALLRSWLPAGCQRFTLALAVRLNWQHGKWVLSRPNHRITRTTPRYLVTPSLCVHVFACARPVRCIRVAGSAPSSSLSTWHHDGIAEPVSTATLTVVTAAR